MKKLLLLGLVIPLAMLVVAAGLYQVNQKGHPSPEDAMNREALNILQDETPYDASALSFSEEAGRQRCDIDYGDQNTQANLTSAQGESAISFSAERDGARWYAKRTLSSKTGMLGSEALSAGDFRALVRQCVRESTEHRAREYSQSVRAENAMSWAVADETRNDYPTAESLALYGQIAQPLTTPSDVAEREYLETRAKAFGASLGTITILPSPQSDPVVQLHSGAQHAAPSQAPLRQASPNPQ